MENPHIEIMEIQHPDLDARCVAEEIALSLERFGPTSFKIIFVHKSLYPWDVVLLILAAKKLLGKKLVYDLDDAEWYHSFLKTYILVKCADNVFCGSRVILNWVKKSVCL